VTGDSASPYPGSRAFLDSERGWFFGRRGEAEKVADLWRLNRLVVAHGQAGSGKTSLLQAGILPLVLDNAKDGEADVFAPGHLWSDAAFPVASLPRHAIYNLALLKSWSPGEALSSLAGLSIREFIRRRAERRAGTILAAIDQADGLLPDTGPRRKQARDFLSDLAEALREWPQFHLLVVLRDTDVERFADALGGGVRHQVRPLGPDAAAEAITGPAEAAGRPFTPEAARVLVGDLLTARITAGRGREQKVCLDHVDPALLQACCTRLWAALPERASMITAADVRRHADVDTALAAHCGSVIAAVARDHDQPPHRLRSQLIAALITDEGARDTKAEGLRETAGLPNAVIRSLEDRHLLSSERRARSRWVELASDRLIEPLRHASDAEAPDTSPADYLVAAEKAFATGDLDLAQHHLRKALETSDGSDVRLHAGASSLLGDIVCERQRYAEAEERYREAAGLFEAVQDDIAVAHQLAASGQMLLAQGQVADAVDRLQAAVRRGPRNLAVQTRLGWALWQLGQRQAGVDVLTGVLAVDGRNPDALRGRGEMLADLDKARDAMRDLDRVERVRQPSARAARGLALAGLGRHRDAGAEISGALVEAPQNGPVLLYAARAEALSGHTTMAEDLAERAICADDPPLPRHQREMALKLAGQDPGCPP
jgi:tetratricopeptide (TPR) repeat protein